MSQWREVSLCNAVRRCATRDNADESVADNKHKDPSMELAWLTFLHEVDMMTLSERARLGALLTLSDSEFNDQASYTEYQPRITTPAPKPFASPAPASRIALFNDDCLKALPLLANESVDFVFCDLPYGQTSASWDSTIDLRALWGEITRVRKPSALIVFTCTTKFEHSLISSNPKEYRYDMVWEKSMCVCVCVCVCV